jgi:hypothetical protein
LTPGRVWNEKSYRRKYLKTLKNSFFSIFFEKSVDTGKKKSIIPFAVTETPEGFSTIVFETLMATPFSPLGENVFFPRGEFDSRGEAESSSKKNFRGPKIRLDFFSGFGYFRKTL